MITRLRARLLRWTALAFAIGLLWSCSDDHAPLGAGGNAQLSLRVEVRDENGVGPPRFAGGRAVSFDFSDVEACATQVGSGAARGPICTGHEIPRGSTRFQLQLEVPVAPYYAIDVELNGVRTENGKASGSGLIYYGRGFAYELSSETPSDVVVVLDEVVPRPLLDRRSGTIAWPLVPGATQYRLLETPAGGAPREHVLTTNGANLAQLSIGSSSIRVRAELADARVSAYSESLVVNGAPQEGVVSGTFVDSSEQPLGCALVKLIGCSSGDTGLFTYTDAEGHFALPPATFGDYFLSFYRPGCADLNDPSGSCFSLNTTSGIDRGAISTTCEGTVWTAITLNWSAEPPDLDLHLWTPAIDDSVHHVFFFQPGSVDTAPFATLDRDQQSGFGPEGISIHQNVPGTYTVAVQHWCEGGSSGRLSTSGAEVRICRNDGSAETIAVPTSGDEQFWWWNVATIDGRTGDVTVVNSLSPGPPFPSPDCQGFARLKSSSAR